MTTDREDRLRRAGSTDPEVRAAYYREAMADARRVVAASQPHRKDSTMKPKKFTKKPVEIEAMQNTRAQYMDVYQWIERNTLGSFDMTEYEGDDAPEPPASGVSIDPTDGRMVISTLEGMHWVNLGDWVIRGVAGDFYPYNPDIFTATYEEATA